MQANEHHLLIREYARVQARCTALVQEQARRIAALEADMMRLRAAVIARDSALAWASEDRAALEREMPGLARRVELGRRVAALQARIGELLRQAPPYRLPSPAATLPELEARLGAADLVICQTGCLSHGDYWRVQDHCKRTGKACVLVERPEALRIVRIHGAGRARVDTLQAQAVE